MRPTDLKLEISAGWWVLWALAFVASLLPPIVFAWADVSGAIDEVPRPLFLTPAHLVYFRWLSELSPLVPVALTALFIAGFRYRHFRRELFAVSAVISMIFSSSCAAYWSAYLKANTQVRTELRELEMSGSPSPEQGNRASKALPDFASDQSADRWFRAMSPSYRSMAEAVDAAGGYSFEANAEVSGGLAWFEEGHGHIALNPSLIGPGRCSIAIFELTNLYQEAKHQEVADRVRRGELNNPEKFALLRESIEYDGIRLHHKILQELHRKIGMIPPEMITWVSNTARTFAEYQPPLAHDYLKAQEASGHTAHYLKLFEKHRAEYVATQPK